MKDLPDEQLVDVCRNLYDEMMVVFKKRKISDADGLVFLTFAFFTYLNSGNLTMKQKKEYILKNMELRFKD